MFIGLDIPIQNKLMSKDELKQREDQLTEYFLYELRKKPVAKKEWLCTLVLCISLI